MADRETGEEKLLVDPIVTVADANVIGATITVEGETATVKSPELTTFNVRDVECETVEFDPVTMSGYVPMATVELTEMMRGEEALPPGGGVTGFVPNPATAPLGSPDTPSVTGELKLSSELTMTVVVPEDPWLTLNVLGETPTEKSTVEFSRIVALAAYP